MTVLLYTDASTKNGVSCWAYKTSLSDEVVTGIIHTSNSAAVECAAIIKGLLEIPSYSEVMVISDFMGAVQTITHKVCKKNPLGEYHIMQYFLVAACRGFIIDALWVPSKCPNRHHQDVDQASKIMLQEYLNSVKL